MINRPTNVEWRYIRYTDPDVALTQSDEDKHLNQDPAAQDDPEGKFLAVQLEFQLSSAVYATMALREVTREETSTWHQAGLTLSGEDQEYKGTKKKDENEGECEGEGQAITKAKGETPAVVEATTGGEASKAPVVDDGEAAMSK